MDAPEQQSMGPLWKVMNPASFSAALIVLTVAGPYQGLQSQNLDYNLTVPSSVSVQNGLCAHIPCSFTYDETARTSREELYGYWFLDTHRYNTRFPRGRLVATNDKLRTLETTVENRFQLTGEPEKGDCSFSILNAELQDAGMYYFRIEDNGFKYSYNSPKTWVLVTALEKPQIWASSAVLSGKEVVYTCLAPGPCVTIGARISWEPSLRSSTTYPWSEQLNNGSWTYGSNFTFTPSLNDQGKRLTCRVWYPNVWQSVENSIILDIFDPPKTVEISTNATDHGHLALCSRETEGDVDSVVAREGESIRLRCKAEGRPDPTLSWVKGDKTLNGSREGKEHSLLLSEVRPEDAGEYQCRAETPYGSANKTLQLCVLYPPRTVTFNVSQAYRRGRALIQDPPTHVAHGSQLTAREGDSLRLLCTAQSHPSSETSWLKGSRTLERHGPSPGSWLELTSLTVEDAGQYACRAKNSLGSAQGIVWLFVAYGPRLSVNQSRSMCWQEDQSLRCNCSLNSWPPPQIRWEVDGQTLSENSGALQVTSRSQEHTVVSSLSWATGNLEESHHIVCHGANPWGIYAMHFPFSPPAKGNHSNIAVAGLCGALVAVILCVLCLGLIKFYKQRKGKASLKAGDAEVLNSANGGHQRANDGSVIYSNIPPLGKKSPRSDQSEATRERTPTTGLRVPSSSIPEPEEVYYATLKFSKMKAKEPTPPEQFVEYSEVKQK